MQVTVGDRTYVRRTITMNDTVTLYTDSHNTGARVAPVPGCFWEFLQNVLDHLPGNVTLEVVHVMMHLCLVLLKTRQTKLIQLPFGVRGTQRISTRARSHWIVVKRVAAVPARQTVKRIRTVGSVFVADEK